MPAKDALWTLLADRALSIGPERTLSTGQVSNFYFDCKRVTLSSDGAPLVGDAFLDKLRLLTETVAAVGGRTLGADPIVGSMILRGHERGTRLDGFYVREKPKGHGTRRLIENPPPSDARVVIVDDVVTTGGSIIEAIDAAHGVGCKVVGVIVLVDRLAGADERIRARVADYFPLYTRNDFPQISEADNCPMRKSERHSSQEASIYTTSGT